MNPITNCRNWRQRRRIRAGLATIHKAGLRCDQALAVLQRAAAGAAATDHGLGEGPDPSRLAAMLDLASVLGLAVHYIGREQIEGRRRELTGDEWGRLQVWLPDFDDFMDQAAVEASGAFIDWAFGKAGIEVAS